MFEVFFQLLAGDQPDGGGRANVRQHRGSCSRLGGGRKGGSKIRRSVGREVDFSCKIHLKTDFNGLPIAFHLTGGEASDSTQLVCSLEIGPDIRPRAALTDKGHDSKANRTACRRRGIALIIPCTAQTRGTSPNSS